MDAAAPGRVLFDLQATQTVDQRHRGIARYAHELALAVEESFPDHVSAYLVNPDLALSETVGRLVGTGKICPVDEVDWRPGDVLHTVSLFEMSVPLKRLVPPGILRAGVRWTVTFHDLIPLLMPDAYLEDPGRRRRYLARLQLLRMADAVLTNSAATRADAVRHLGLDEDRVIVVGTGTGPQFVPPASRTDAASAAAAAVGDMSARYVFYVGGFDRRKNLEPLLIAWSLLDPGVRAGRTLVVCAVPDPLDRYHLLHLAAELGISGEVRLTGVLPDHVLLLLHQGAELFVFPSLYEGYGLPVAEALACGAPVLAADNSSLPEIVDPEALFDPNDPDVIAAAVTRGLTDEAFRARRLAAAGRPPSTWAAVAAAVVAAHRGLSDGTVPPHNRASDALWRNSSAKARLTAADPRRRTPASGESGGPGRRVAFVGVLRPDGGEHGERNSRLVEALATRVEVRAFADRPVDAPLRLRSFDTKVGAPVSPLAALEAAEGIGGPFAAIVYAVADDSACTGALNALRRRRDGIVVAWDVSLAELYGAADQSGALPEGLRGVIGATYGDLVLSGIGTAAVLPVREARRLGLIFARDVLRHCRHLVVPDPAEATVADLDARPGDRSKIRPVDGDPAAVAEAISGLLPTRPS